MNWKYFWLTTIAQIVASFIVLSMVAMAFGILLLPMYWAVLTKTWYPLVLYVVIGYLSAKT